MDLYHEIFRRKSTQKFNLTALDSRVVDKIKHQLATLPEREASCDVRMHFITDGTAITEKLSLFGRIKAPHYILVTGNRNEACLISAGYSAEYLVLYLTSLGIATSYMGSVLDKLTATHILGSELIADVIIAIAFGASRNAADVYQDPARVKRLPLDSLLLGATPTPDQRKILEAVRLAPSFMNSQSWRFRVEADEILLYQEKLPYFRKKFFAETCYFDMGVALAHLEIAARHFGYDCQMHYNEEVSTSPEYIQTIQLIPKNKEDTQ